MQVKEISTARAVTSRAVINYSGGKYINNGGYIGSMDMGTDFNTPYTNNNSMFMANLPLWISIGICSIMGAILGIIVAKRSANK